ncbi:hypothetical protein T484DRAFT_1782771 [Baffinella frigidus]|nr:hypothetical protein T484DRAFT_1782771 [Cryptophyta sp. CCMP2293]
MRLFALLALLVAPCGAFLQGAAPGWGLALRSLSSPRGAQQPFCARQLVAARHDGAAVGGWGAGQAQVEAGRRVASCVTLYMEGRAGAAAGDRGSAGTGRGRGGADYAPAVGRGDGAPTRPSGGRGGYRGRGGGIPAKGEGGPLDARQITGVIKNCREVGELGRILQDHKGSLNQIHVSAAWVCLARIGRGGGGGEARTVLTALQHATRDVLDQMGAREIANVHHSMARLHDSRRMLAPNYERALLLEAMQRRATATAGEFIPQAVSNVLWALATMGERADRELLEAMQTRAKETAGEFKPQEVANLMWALATMGEKPDRELLEAMQNRATATAGEFIPQTVSNLLWSLATMGEKADRGLLEAMQRRAKETAGEFKPQEVANSLWALATMGERADRGMLEALQTQATAKAGEFILQDVVNVLWALATMGQKADRGLLEAMQRRATATAGKFIPKAVAKLLWALATMGIKADRNLLEAMQTRATATAGEFNPQDVSNVLWALATMGKKADLELLEAMQNRATANAGEFNPQAISNLLWALATMGAKADQGLLEAMQRRATATVGEFNPQTVSNVLWALAVMGDSLDGSLAVLVDLLAARILELRDQFTDVGKLQLHQWLLSCELGLASGASLPKGVARVKQEMGAECLETFSLQATRESQLQQEVAAAVRSAGLEVEIEEEYRDARSGYSINVLVRRLSAAGSTGGAEWAVEVDGPFHFLGDGKSPSGSTLLKRKHLEQLGYTVVLVPFWEWQALMGEEAQRGYLVDKLGA